MSLRQEIWGNYYDADDHSVNTNKLPPRTSSPKLQGCAEWCLSGKPPGPGPCRRLALGCRGELDDQSDGLDHGLNPLESFYQLT